MADNLAEVSSGMAGGLPPEVVVLGAGAGWDFRAADTAAFTWDAGAVPPPTATLAGAAI
jgi:hypothetical protein